MSDRPKVFISQQVTMTLTGGAANIGSLSQAFVTRTGRNLFGVTLGHTWLDATLVSDQIETAQNNLSVGIVVAPSLMDAIDFPDVRLHQGDWQLHKHWSFGPQLTIGLMMSPFSVTEMRTDQRSMRKIRREDEVPFVVARINNATVGDLTLRMMITQMYFLA